MIDYIGVDIGGTNIRVGAIDENEEIIFSYIEPTFEDVNTAEDLYTRIKKLIEIVPEYSNAKAIGIGFPGSVDKSSREIVTSRNVGILVRFSLISKLKKDFNKPVFIENDARVAAFAEAIKGKGINNKTVCYVTISTGLGGGVVINKKIYRGANNLGMYISRMVLDGKNMSNDLISGKALIKQAREIMNMDIKNPSELFELAKNNNKAAKQIVEKFKANLTVLLLNISFSINPNIIILGGGVLKAKEYFLEDVIENFRNNIHPLAKDTIIDTAKFEEPGILGAALLAKNIFENEN